MLRLILTILVTPSTLSAAVRAVLKFASSAPLRADGWVAPRRWLVVIPARDEGRNVEATLTSIATAAKNAECDIRTLLLLDGVDDVAATVASELNAAVALKEPAGPSKGAVLRWLVETRQPDLRECDAILLLDVGSEVSPAFFREFRWPPDAAASQAILHGSGEGVGESAAASERSAQTGEDGGRQRLGWTVRLRGTGTVFTPEAFLSIIPRLRTQVEDEEASLLLAASGGRVTLAPVAAFVRDEKPAAMNAAAGQRARWLIGRIDLPFRHAGSVAKLIARRPLEGFTFLFDLAARPLSLSIPFRLAAGSALVILSWPSPWRSVAGVAGALAILSTAADVHHLIRGGTSIASALTMSGSWITAVALAPRAFFRWIKVRSRRS